MMPYLFFFDIDFLLCPCLCFNTILQPDLKIADCQYGNVWKET